MWIRDLISLSRRANRVPVLDRFSAGAMRPRPGGVSRGPHVASRGPVRPSRLTVVVVLTGGAEEAVEHVVAYMGPGSLAWRRGPADSTAAHPGLRGEVQHDVEPAPARWRRETPGVRVCSRYGLRPVEVHQAAHLLVLVPLFAGA